MSVSDQQLIEELGALYYCPESGGIEHPTESGFRTCCSAPENHVFIAERLTDLRERRDGLGQVPEDGPGKQEEYWQRRKLQACITHLRDLEDFYRLRGGTPTSFNMVRADRARELYETIREDYLEGNMKRPSLRERAEVAEERLRVTTHALIRLAVERCALEGWNDPREWLGPYRDKDVQLAADAYDAIARLAAPQKEPGAFTEGRDPDGRW